MSLQDTWEQNATTQKKKRGEMTVDAAHLNLDDLPYASNIGIAVLHNVHNDVKIIKLRSTTIESYMH